MHQRRVVGLGLSFGGAQALRSLLFEVGTLDPLTYVVVSVVVLVVATVATLWPALRACRMPPVRALRND